MKWILDKYLKINFYGMGGLRSKRRSVFLFHQRSRKYNTRCQSLTFTIRLLDTTLITNNSNLFNTAQHNTKYWNKHSTIPIFVWCFFVEQNYHNDVVFFEDFSTRKRKCKLKWSIVSQHIGKFENALGVLTKLILLWFYE